MQTEDNTKKTCSFLLFEVPLILFKGIKNCQCWEVSLIIFVRSTYSVVEPVCIGVCPLCKRKMEPSVLFYQKNESIKQFYINKTKVLELIRFFRGLGEK